MEKLPRGMCKSCPLFGRPQPNPKDRPDSSYCKECRRDRSKMRYHGVEVVKGKVPQLLIVLGHLKVAVTQRSWEAVEDYLKQVEAGLTGLLPTQVSGPGQMSLSGMLEVLGDMVEGSQAYMTYRGLIQERYPDHRFTTYALDTDYDWISDEDLASLNQDSWKNGRRD